MIQKKLLRMTLTVAVAMGSYASATAQNSNVAYQDNNVRFTVITDGAVRMEYAPDGKFLDDRSFVAVNRSYPAAKFQVKAKGKKVEIATDCFKLSYLKGSGKFTDKNLVITSAKGKKAIPFSWKPGTKDNANLKGTYRTLDGYDGEYKDGKTDQKMPIEDGLLSKSGWTFIDDSENYTFDNSDWAWVKERPNCGNTQDWYFLAYGHNYKKALKDYTTFAGKVPLPPRYAFGYWWSRYWSYSDNELRSLVDNMKNYGFPLDVLVIDMDWHHTEAGKGAWGGYAWNERLFPDHAKFLKWVKGNNLNVTFNLHPADGVHAYDTHYSDLAEWMGMNPAEKKDIPWLASDKRFMEGWYGKILRPMEKEGVDFWWLDWQQWPNDKKLTRLSNTWWLNYTTFTDMERNRETRPMLYHRWGGLGNHRYQIGFSGDTYISWSSLDFQPYFNSTASNVLYGYWSHDIGGHMGAKNIDPEMYIRWMQFGALSPILRTHSTKDGGLNKEPWVFSNKQTTILRDIVNNRYAMAPYIYAMARKTYEDGISLCRPMYYDYPDNEEAYANRNEYMFGDQMLVSPITSPMNDGISTQKVWLPAGNDWYETASGTLLKGGQTVERKFQLDEYPLYIKAGSIIPEYGKVKNLRSNDETITVTVYPGAADGSFEMYEDNGNDKHYATEFATTQLTSTHNGNELNVTIGERKGKYAEMPAKRQFKLKVVATAVPEKVTVNGKAVEFEYDGNNLSLLVDIPETDCNTAKHITVTYPENATDVTDGLIGKFRHIQQNVVALKYHNAYIVLDDALGTMESTGTAITYHPEEFTQRIEAFRKNFANLKEVLKENKVDEEFAEKFLRLAY